MHPATLLHALSYRCQDSRPLRHESDRALKRRGIRPWALQALPHLPNDRVLGEAGAEFRVPGAHRLRLQQGMDREQVLSVHAWIGPTPCQPSTAGHQRAPRRADSAWRRRPPRARAPAAPSPWRGGPRRPLAAAASKRGPRRPRRTAVPAQRPLAAWQAGPGRRAWPAWRGETYGFGRDIV